jgi:hypothetical protein
VLAALNRPLEAAAAAQNALNLGVPGSMKRAFVLSAAQNSELGGNFPEAISLYRMLIDLSDSSGDHALALSRIAAIKRVQGDLTYVDEQRQPRRLFRHRAGVTAPNRQSRAAVTVDPNVRGLTHRHNDYRRPSRSSEPGNLSPYAPSSALAYYHPAPSSSREANSMRPWRTGARSPF